MVALRTIAIVPVRSLEGGKSRLAARLDAEERADLVVRLLGQTIDAATPHTERVIVVTADDEIADLVRGTAVETLRQRSSGLNDALREGADRAAELGAEAVLVLPPDLPFVAAAEVGRIVGAAEGRAPVVVLVPDRHGGGTNALLVAPPGAIDFAFGSMSRPAHIAAAERAGIPLVELDGPLQLDLDTPEDLLLAEDVLTPPTR